MSPVSLLSGFPRGCCGAWAIAFTIACLAASGIVVAEPAVAEPIDKAGMETVFGPWFPPPPRIDILWPGDANSDNRVDLADFNTLKVNFGRGAFPNSSDPFYSQPSTWEQADFTLDKRTDLRDFQILKQNFGWVLPAVPVPEPSAGALCAMAFLLTLALAGKSIRRRTKDGRDS
jgi:hypothetical protein